MIEPNHAFGDSAGMCEVSSIMQMLLSVRVDENRGEHDKSQSPRLKPTLSLNSILVTFIRSYPGTSNIVTINC